MEKRLTLFLTCLFLSIGMAMAQMQINGTVVSADDGQPVVGASVIVHGTKTGTATNVDGKFTLNVPKGAKLMVSYVGMVTKTVAAAHNMTIRLVSDDSKLDEVIVVAYGTAKKSTYTGSAVHVDSKRLDRVQAADATKALEGMVAGLSVTSPSGRAGESTVMRIRGIGSLNASSSPLIILDGAPYSGDINAINTKDIASINVLKDAASAALYGARGANGVIMITTKSGDKGKVQVSFDARIGSNQRAVPEYDIITDPGMYYKLTWEGLKNSVTFKEEPEENPGQWASANLVDMLGGYNIYKTPDDKVVDEKGNLTKAPVRYEDAARFNDWMGTLYEPKTREEYNMSITKGSAKSKVYFSVGYLNDRGFSMKTDFERLTTRMSYDSDITDWLRIGASSQFAKTTAQNPAQTEEGNFSNLFMWSRMIAPIYPIYKHDKDGKILRDAHGEMVYDDSQSRQYAGGSNLIRQTQLNITKNINYYLTQNARVDVKLPYNFKFSSTATFNGNWWRWTNMMNPLVGDGQAYGGILNKEVNQMVSLNWNQILNWDKTFNDFGVHVMLGHENYHEKTNFLNGEKKGLLDPTLPEFRSGANISDLDSYGREYKVEGYFGQVTADYMGKYFASASLRRDGSSVFHPKHRWGTFGSVGASWRISEEEFLKDVEAVQNLKLRVSYGVQGNDYLYLPNTNPPLRAYTPYTNLYRIGSTGTESVYGPAYKGNENITWEKNNNLDVGLEFSLWRGLLAGELDFFSRRTSDMLFNLPISSTTGFDSEPVNFGKMVNTGFEFSLSSNVYSDRNINVNVGVNGTAYKNKITELPAQFRKDGISKGFRILKENGGIFDYYMVKSAGVNPENGDQMYWCWNEKDKKFEKVGSGDYSTSLKNRQFVGSALPKMTGGFYANASAYGFDFSVQFSYRVGGIVYDGNYKQLMTPGELGTNWHKDILKRWTPENTKTDVPRLHTQSQGLDAACDRFLVDGSFLCLNNLTFGYSLPKSVLSKVKIQALRLYFAADNLGLWTKRKGLDPRLALSGTQQYSVNSAVRTLSFGVSLNL